MTRARHASKRAKKGGIVTVQARDLKALRAEIARRTRKARPATWNADPEDVQRSVARLVLALVEFLRQLLERQAIRRMKDGR